jgi:hypothetical protein
MLGIPGAKNYHGEVGELDAKEVCSERSMKPGGKRALSCEHRMSLLLPSFGMTHLNRDAKGRPRIQLIAFTLAI